MSLKYSNQYPERAAASAASGSQLKTAVCVLTKTAPHLGKQSTLPGATTWHIHNTQMKRQNITHMGTMQTRKIELMSPIIHRISGAIV